MKKTIIWILVLLPLNVWCQSKSLRSMNDDFEFSLNGGYGSYLMLSLKDLQNSLLDNMGLPLVKTSSFPPYLNYSFKFGKNQAKSSSGIMGGMMSTGSRTSLADYSGFYTSDINCVAKYIGVYKRSYGKTYTVLNQSMATGFSMNLSFLYSDITMSDHLRLFSTEAADFDETGTFVFNSFGLYTEPSFFVQHMFSRNFGLELNVGGALSLCTPLYYEKFNLDLYFYSQRRYVNWSGLRVSIGVISVF
jgi:hypothetical protein